MAEDRVLLTPLVKRKLLALAHRRNDGKTPEQSRHRDPAYTDLQIDYLGLKGEFVVSTVYGVPFDQRGYGRRGDDGVDVRTPEPGAVKTNHRTGGYLLVERERDLSHVERVHLVEGPCLPPLKVCVCRCVEEGLNLYEPWTYRGWISPTEFWRQAEQANWGLGERWYVRQRALIKREEPEIPW